MFFSVIFKNIIGFDGFIFIVAAVNIFIFVSARRAAARLYNCMHRQVYTPMAEEEIKEMEQEISSLSEKKVSALRERAESRYTLYVNITGIFPLLGILGTVISLLGMVGSPDSVTNGFFAALTSTFWGLVFAIGFKFTDGFISSKLDDGERAAELYIYRNRENENSSGGIRTSERSGGMSAERSTGKAHKKYTGRSSEGAGGRELSEGEKAAREKSGRAKSGETKSAGAGAAEETAAGKSSAKAEEKAEAAR